MLLSTSVFLFFLFLTYAIFLMGSRKPYLRQERLEQRVREALQENAKAPDISSEIYLEDSIGGGATLNRLLSSVDVIKKLDQRIKQADVKITVSRLLLFCLVAGLMAFFATYTISNGLVAIVFGAIALRRFRWEEA